MSPPIQILLFGQTEQVIFTPTEQLKATGYDTVFYLRRKASFIQQYKTEPPKIARQTGRPTHPQRTNNIKINASLLSTAKDLLLELGQFANILFRLLIELAFAHLTA